MKAAKFICRPHLVYIVEVSMKFISILKAIASGLVWGLGQLLNRQYLKALFFFVFFVGFVSIEFFTSNYLGETDAYGYIPGNDYGDDYFGIDGFLADYLYNTGQLKDSQGNIVFNPNPQPVYQPFEDYLTEIGGPEMLNEQLFVEFMAKDLLDNSPTIYKNIKTNQEFLIEGFDDSNKIQLFTFTAANQSLWLDTDTNTYYQQRTRQIDGINTIEYVETTVLTGVRNDANTRQTRDGLVSFTKNAQIIRVSSGVFAGYYVDVSINGVKHYLNLETEAIVTVGQLPLFANVFTEGPIFMIDGDIYEYYQAGTYYAGKALQYKPTAFTQTFRQNIFNTYSLEFNRFTNRDFTRFMIKVYFEMNPELKEIFIEQYDNFYYEKAGIFLKGFWSVYSLGVAQKQEFTQQNALLLALAGNYGTRTLPYNLSSTPKPAIIPNENVTILGHITLFLLIEGLISIILFLFFMIVLIWSVRDAYKVAEAKRLKHKVLKDTEYFRDVYEEAFEYIILFPAMFVLGFISIMPIAFGFIIAFTDIKGGESQNALFNWVGLANFAQIFDFASGLGSSFGSAFWRVLGWTVIWAILSTFTVFFGGFLQALILNSEKVVFRKLWRTILILPWAIPALLSQMVFSVMFNENGFINQFLLDIGVIKILQDLGILGVNFNDLTGIIKYFYLGPGDRIQWFTNVYNKTFVRGSLVILNIWLGFPYFMALMTGVMTAIDQTLYEAADIDGANKFQKVTQITMPLVLYSTAPILIMTFSGNFNNFGVIYFITGGGPNNGMDSRGYAGDTDILISWMYKLTTEHYIYNMASVFSVLIFFFVGSITAWNLSRTRAFQED